MEKQEESRIPKDYKIENFMPNKHYNFFPQLSPQFQQIKESKKFDMTKYQQNKEFCKFVEDVIDPLFDAILEFSFIDRFKRKDNDDFHEKFFDLKYQDFVENYLEVHGKQFEGLTLEEQQKKSKELIKEYDEKWFHNMQKRAHDWRQKKRPFFNKVGSIEEVYDETHWYQWLIENHKEFKELFLNWLLKENEKGLPNWKNENYGQFSFNYLRRFFLEDRFLLKDYHNKKRSIQFIYLNGTDEKEHKFELRIIKFDKKKSPQEQEYRYIIKVDKEEINQFNYSELIYLIEEAIADYRNYVQFKQYVEPEKTHFTLNKISNYPVDAKYSDHDSDIKSWFVAMLGYEPKFIIRKVIQPKEKTIDKVQFQQYLNLKKAVLQDQKKKDEEFMNLIKEYQEKKKLKQSDPDYAKKKQEKQELKLKQLQEQQQKEKEISKKVQENTLAENENNKLTAEEFQRIMKFEPLSYEQLKDIK